MWVSKPMDQGCIQRRIFIFIKFSGKHSAISYKQLFSMCTFDKVFGFKYRKRKVIHKLTIYLWDDSHLIGFCKKNNKKRIKYKSMTIT